MPLCTESLSVVTCNKFGSLVICVAFLYCSYLLRSLSLFCWLLSLAPSSSLFIKRSLQRSKVSSKDQAQAKQIHDADRSIIALIDWRISEYRSSYKKYINTFNLKLKLFAGQDVKPRRFEKDSDIGLNCFAFKHIVLVFICMYWPRNQVSKLDFEGPRAPLSSKHAKERVSYVIPKESSWCMPST